MTKSTARPSAKTSQPLRNRGKNAGKPASQLKVRQKPVKSFEPSVSVKDVAKVDEQDASEGEDLPLKPHLQSRKPRTASHKKGAKTFASEKSMLSIVECIANDLEVKDASKLYRAQAQAEKAMAREVPKDQKQQRKQELLNAVKDRIKNKRKDQKKLKRLHRAQEPISATMEFPKSRKSVSFDE